jgi:hypothetical protein
MANPTQGFQIGARVASNYRPVAPTPLNTVDGRTLVGEADTGAVLRGMKAGEALAQGLLGGIDFKGLFDPVEKAKREKALEEIDFYNTNKDLIQQNELNKVKTDLALGNAQIAALADANPFAIDIEGKKIDLNNKKADAESNAKTRDLKDDLLVQELESQLGRLPTVLELQEAKDAAELDNLETGAVVNQAQRDALKPDAGNSAPTESVAATDDGLPPMPKKTIFDPFSRSVKTNPEYTQWLQLKTHLEKKKIDSKMKLEGVKNMTPTALNNLGGKTRIAVAAKKLSGEIAKNKEMLSKQVGPIDQRMNVLGEKVGWAGTQEWRDMMKAYTEVRNTILKERSGGAVTPSEAQRFEQEIGDPNSADESFFDRAGSFAGVIQGEISRDMDALKESGYKVPKSYENAVQGSPQAEVQSNEPPVVNTPEEARQLPANVPTFRTPEGDILKNPNYKPTPSTPGAVEG